MRRLLPYIICAAHLAVLAWLAGRHPYGNFATETDFYHLYAPDAERLAEGQFPLNTFQGPGYPAVVVLLSKLTGAADLFTVAKWLSVASAAACGLLAYRLFSGLFNQWVGLGAQLLVTVSGEFPQFSINAATDVFFLAVCLASLVVLLEARPMPAWRLAISGGLAGAAFVVRYNGLFLAAACLAGILLFDLLDLPPWRRLRPAAIFLAAFIAVASPWLVANYRHNGSPLYNTNYLNMATEFYPELVAGKTNQDGTRALEEKFRSFGDVVRHDPARIAAHYPANLLRSLKSIVAEGLIDRWVALAALAGLALALMRARSAGLLTLLAAGVVYLLLMALNHWETRYYFFVMIICAGLAAFAMDRLRHAGLRRPWSYALPAIGMAALWGVSFAESRADVARFLSARPREIAAARDYLARVNPAGHRLRIVARKPHLPYMSRNEWVFFPQVKSIEEFRAWVAANNVDYIAIGKREIKERKELAPLSNPEKAPQWLSAEWVYDDPPFVLYKPVR